MLCTYLIWQSTGPALLRDPRMTRAHPLSSGTDEKDLITFFSMCAIVVFARHQETHFLSVQTALSTHV